MTHIVIADDDETLRHFLQKSLENEGFKIASFENGNDAFDYIKSTSDIDLLLTDIIMPGMDGFELSAAVKKIYPNLKTMFMTGFSSMNEHTNKETKKIISKPFHLKDIINEIKNTLNAKAA